MGWAALGVSPGLTSDAADPPDGGPLIWVVRRRKRWVTSKSMPGWKRRAHTLSSAVVIGDASSVFWRSVSLECRS